MFTTIVTATGFDPATNRLKADRTTRLCYTVNESSRMDYQTVFPAYELLKGLEPLTSALGGQRATNCAKAIPVSYW